MKQALIDLRDKPLGRVLVVLAGVVLAFAALTQIQKTADAYEHTGCHYETGTIEPISYRFFSVGSEYETAFVDAEAAWDDTTVPGYFEEHSTSWDPEINVVDGAFMEGYWGETLWACPSDTGNHDGNEVEIRFDTDGMSDKNANQKKLIAEHELGHAYGLAHVFSGCRVMRPGTSKFFCPDLPASDDVNGVDALY